MNLGKILMSKFLLNLLVQTSKAIVYSKIQILFGNNSSQISAHPAQPRPCRPALPRKPPCTRSAHSAWAALVNLPKGASSLSLCNPSTTLSLSHITAMWGPPISSTPFLAPADPNLISIVPRRIWWPRTARPPSLRCQSRPLTPPPWFPLLNPREHPPWPSMASAINRRRYSPAFPPRAAPAPYKR
jgi:hypothetical protein